ncbi:hypothetical protein pqer_cds_345 [Pandoravirus quercus]|uniref:DUF5898 domain-containing protein n=2 Tax=Pandoravirus TaxID=2060084 RepID=A0A2U7U8K8_9VIRU|nr:hypothetical protein pqer_cds_345 [Pandoravirus quercus]AVK74767.1 hypothetical protein pqer_cds_345 [Pandoravirus quercus]QBZ80944.1 hypothetical protein pclt_cds_346 [Pandoravirus celtis]
MTRRPPKEQRRQRCATDIKYPASNKIEATQGTMGETLETVQIGALFTRLTPEQRIDLAKAIGSTSVGLIGLPPMGRHARHHRRRAVPAAPSNTVQTTISATVRPFATDERVPLYQWHRSVMWILAERDDCSRNMSTRDLVLCALNDIRIDTGLRDHVEFWTQGRDLFCGRSDLFFPFRVGDGGAEGRFLGAILVRNEADNKNVDILDDPRTCADVFDVLCMIKAYHGATAPMAIVSTYARWRLFWLDDAEHDYTPDGQIATLEPAAIAGGTLCGTVSYDCCDPHLVRVIATALHHMHAQSTNKSPETNLVARVGASMARVAWERHVPKTFVLRRDGNAAGLLATTDFVLIDDLGAGADGRAWKARPCGRKHDNLSPKDANGIGVGNHLVQPTEVVIKFGHESADAEPGDEDDLQSGGCLWREALVWRRAWGVSTAHTTALCGRPALVMPYARPVAANVDDANRVGAIEVVLQAVERMAAAGLCHDDLHWRHVGIIPRCLSCNTDTADGIVQEAGGMVVFFDLARVSRRRPEKASARMKAALGLCSRDGGDDGNNSSDSDDDTSQSDTESTGNIGEGSPREDGSADGDDESHGGDAALARDCF